MSNPFVGTDPEIRKRSDLLGRVDAFQKLDKYIKKGRNIVIMGVEGVGKSSFLNCFFNPEYRRKMAREEKTLIKITDFPTDRNVNDVYQYLTDGVIGSLDTLDEPETIDEYIRLKAKVEQKCASTQDAASRFQQVCECLEQEYSIMFVIDGFERFVFSPDVTMDHHSLLNNLITKNLRFVVSTNYNFNQDSLPKTISGSFFLQKFADNDITITGLTPEDCELFLIDGDFDKDEIEQLYILTGGIPVLLRRAAYYRYQQTHIDHKDDWNEVLFATAEDARAKSTMRRWCRWLSPPEASAIQKLLTMGPGYHNFENSTLKAAASLLVARGFLENPIDKNGLHILDAFQFNSWVLKKYCLDNPVHSEDPNSILRKQSIPTPPTPEEHAEANEAADFNYAEALRQYRLSEEELEKYNDKVQKFIKTGVYVDQMLLGKDLLDHSPAFIEFAKALEAHINETIFPMAQIIWPDYYILEKPLDQMDSITLGQLVKLMNRRPDRFTTFVELAGAVCQNKGLTGFPTSWWERLRKDLSYIDSSAGVESVADIRNGMAHSTLITAEQGEALLKMLFAGDKSLFNRCYNLYDAALKKNII